MICRICSSTTRPYLEKNGYLILRCGSCGFGQVDVTADEISEFYDQAYFDGSKAQFAQQENVAIPRCYKYWIELNLRRLRTSEGLKVLEIGPGLGAPIGGYFQQTRPDVEFAAIEISEHACTRLAARGFTVFQGRVTNPDTVEACRGKYDLIYGNEVIEHDPEPHAFVRAVHDMLKPGGWAAFTTGNLDGGKAKRNKEKWYYLDPPAHVSYYTPTAAKQLFGGEGFHNVSVKRYGFNYIELKLKTHIPGILLATHLSNVSTGMSIAAQRAGSGGNV